MNWGAKNWLLWSKHTDCVVKYKWIYEYLLSGLIIIQIFLKILIKDYEMS